MVLQRVKRASVTVDGEVVSSIGAGMCLLVGVAQGDGDADVRAAVEKISPLRIFSDVMGKMNLSIRDVGGEILVVSQFTLLGDARRGRRPSFSEAADPEVAEPLLRLMVELFIEAGVPTKAGVFGASMEVDLVNDGPVTLVFDVENARLG